MALSRGGGSGARRPRRRTRHGGRRAHGAVGLCDELREGVGSGRSCSGHSSPQLSPQRAPLGRARRKEAPADGGAGDPQQVGVPRE